MGGNIFLGLVIFGILMIVNFTVITKGAGRMAEVAARFALDAMPGKQLAIDSDVSSGAIDHQAAQDRRRIEQDETTFLGSLDGASKFVKGDAIVGLLITLLNLVMGLSMGLFVHGMHLSKAFETYAILTVGDGLVSQIPAVIISISAALLLSRGGTMRSTDNVITQQLCKHPQALIVVALLMVVFAAVPGLPPIPFLLLASGLGGLIYYLTKRQTANEINTAEEVHERQPQSSIGDVLDLEDIHVEFAPNLVDMILHNGTGLDLRISNMRQFLATRYGIVLPQIRLTDDHALPDNSYIIRIHGVEQAKAEIIPDRMLALFPSKEFKGYGGMTIQEPVFGAPAEWIDTTVEEEAVLDGVAVVSPSEVLATHLLETLKDNFPRLLTLRALRRQLEELSSLSDQKRAKANQALFEDIIPEKVSMEQLLRTLQALLEEQVSIRNLPLILEAIQEVADKSAPLIIEHVRQKLGFQIIGALKNSDGAVPIVQLAQDWEDTFNTYQIVHPSGLVDGPFDLNGSDAVLKFVIPPSAQTPKLIIQNGLGEIVFEKFMSPGDNEFTLKGKDQTGIPLHNGPFTATIIEAVDAKTASISKVGSYHEIVEVQQINGTSYIHFENGEIRSTDKVEALKG